MYTYLIKIDHNLSIFKSNYIIKNYKNHNSNNDISLMLPPWCQNPKLIPFLLLFLTLSPIILIDPLIIIIHFDSITIIFHFIMLW